MTDDLAMDAVAAYAADGAVAVIALEAGNDLIITTDYHTQIPKVIEAVESGAPVRGRHRHRLPPGAHLEAGPGTLMKPGAVIFRLYQQEANIR